MTKLQIVTNILLAHKIYIPVYLFGDTEFTSKQVNLYTSCLIMYVI